MTSASVLYSAEQVRALDAFAIAHGTAGYTLMRRAAEAALRALRSRWPTAMRVAIVTGGGNNGGDGYVLARFAQAAGLSASVLAVVPPAQLRGDALRGLRGISRQRRPDPRPTSRRCWRTPTWWSMRLLGTGLREPVRAPMAQAIQAINACGRPVFSLDLPSGLNADSGEVMGAAVNADCTISFVAHKTGLFLGAGPDHVGRLLFDDLEVAAPAEARFRPLLERISESEIARALPPRGRDANKGDFGRVLIVGGGPGMPGAMRLAGESCLRVGAGLVTVATAPDNLVAVVAGRPELIVHGVKTAAELEPLLKSASVVAVGPGLGQSAWAEAMLEGVLHSGKPLVIDADALNLLASAGRAAPAGSVLTPHPGEAARLLGSTAAAVQSDRMAALRALHARHPGSVIVLKGAGTLIAADGQIPGICERGNPAMAAPGMGDVLTGAIAGIRSQCGDPWLSARAAVLAHALAGEELARDRSRGILALELAEAMSRWVSR